MTTGTPMAWVVFGAVVVVMLALDLGVFHRKAHVIGAREAAVWSLVWISVALLFNLGIYFRFGADRALEFFQAWLIEKALSVDNLFVFLGRVLVLRGARRTCSTGCCSGGSSAR